MEIDGYVRVPSDQIRNLSNAWFRYVDLRDDKSLSLLTIEVSKFVALNTIGGSE